MHWLTLLMSTLKKMSDSFTVSSFFSAFSWAIANRMVETNVTNWIAAAVISDYVGTLIFQLYHNPYSISDERHLYHSCISAVSQLHQLTHNMTKDCSLNYKFSTWKLQAHNLNCVHKLFFVCLFCLEIQNNVCMQHVLSS